MDGEILSANRPMPESLDIKDSYNRSRQSALREYSINIRFLSVGCVIEVGCKSIPFTNVDEAMTELNNYVKNPQEAVNKWEKIFNQQ